MPCTLGRNCEVLVTTYNVVLKCARVGGHLLKYVLSHEFRQGQEKVRYYSYIHKTNHGN